MLTVIRTVVIPSVVLTERKYQILRELEEMYKQMVTGLVDFGVNNKVTTFVGLKKYMCRRLQEKYPNLRSHYIQTACQDASARIKSFFRLKSRGRAKTEKPVVKSVSIWLDETLWIPIGYTAIRVATHKGWITIELQSTKLFWKYINSGWRLRTQPRLKLFEKMIEPNVPKGWITIDVNENNVTMLVSSVAYKLVTMLRWLTRRYHEHKRRLQKGYS